jgi:hypothetical protein
MVSNNCLECFHGYFQGFPSHNPLKPLSTCKIIQCICKGFSDLRCLKVTMWWCKPIHHSKFSFEMHGVIYATEPICSIFDTNFYVCWRLNKYIASRWKLEILYLLHWSEERFEKVCEYKPLHKLVIGNIQCRAKNWSAIF